MDKPIYIIYLLTLCLPLLTVLIVFAMRYVASIQESRARLANDGAYRRIADGAAAAAAQTASTLATIQTGLADVRTRLTAIERMLDTVQ